MSSFTTSPPKQQSIGNQLLGSLINNPEIQQSIFSALGGLFAGLLAKLTGQGKHVVVPAVDRPLVDGLPDDKLVVLPKPTPHPAAALGYTSLKLGVSKAQYNHELFPEQYTEANKFGLYQPARQSTYNRKSKVWFDATPFKGDHAVQQDEGGTDGILWLPEFHVLYNGDETIVKANLAQLQDTANGSGRPIQVVLGDSVAVGFSPWDYAFGYLNQINVGENEGTYEVWVAIPKLGLVSERITFSVS